MKSPASPRLRKTALPQFRAFSDTILSDMVKEEHGKRILLSEM
jgi:hypothetical protein